MAQAADSLTGAQIAAKLGVNTNVFDKTAQLSSSNSDRQKLFYKFNGKGGDEYMLLFGQAMNVMSDTNAQTSAQNLQSSQQQAAILAISKALEGMKDLGQMLQFLRNMQGAFKSNSSVMMWIKDQISNIKSGVLDNAGKEFYWSLMDHWYEDQKEMPSTLAFLFQHKNPSQMSQIVNSYLAEHPSLSQTKINAIRDFQHIGGCFRYTIDTTLGFGHRYIVPNEVVLVKMFVSKMHLMYGSKLPTTELYEAYFQQTFTIEAINWFKNAWFTTDLSGNVADQKQVLNIAAKELANSEQSFAAHASNQMNNVMGVLEEISSADSQLSSTIQNLIVNPEDMQH